MDDVELIEKAIAVMRNDPDPRWHAVADLMAGTPLGYARMLANHPQAPQIAINYPDAGRAVTLASTYLSQQS